MLGGNGSDCEIFSRKVKKVVGIDIKLHPNWSKIIKDHVYFCVADVCNLPFSDHAFDMVFEMDVLHHVNNFKRFLDEIKRVTKRNGRVIIAEGNRNNPISYLHMTLMKGHQHFTKKHFEYLVASVFNNVIFKSIESHVYPIKSNRVLKWIHVVEDFLCKIPFVNNYLSYNIAFIENKD